MKKRAVITGCTGQIGSYLIEHLLSLDYEVHGIIRKASNFPTYRLNHIYENPGLKLHYGNLDDPYSLSSLFRNTKPDEIYNLAAQSHVRVSFDIPYETGNITAMGAARVLEAARLACPEARIYQASSSEMFGNAVPPQSETTVFDPRSPYAAAKVYAYYLTKNYREAFGMFATNGICFNCESPRRGETFVTRKITRGFSKIKKKQGVGIALGNTQALRDWGFAGDYAKAMHAMMQLDKADDFVIATGKSHSVEDLCTFVCDILELGNPYHHITIDPRLFRPTEVNHLQGDASKLMAATGWAPEVSFSKLVHMMVEEDMR